MRALFLLFCCLPSLVFAKSPQEVFEIASKSVVLVELDNINAQNELVTEPVGSGVVVGKHEILTNCHVAKAELEGLGLRVREKGTEAVTGAQSYARIQGKDLCLLKTDRPVGQPAKLGTASQLKVGASVYAIGAPQGLELTLSDGVVSQLRSNPKAPLIQTTAPISPGSSGGGLFDSEGKLVGITTFYLEDGQNLNFALPVEWLNELYKPESRIYNRIGMECQYLINKTIGKITDRKRVSDSELEEMKQCSDLTTRQLRTAFADYLESAPLPSPEESRADLRKVQMISSSEDGSLVVYLKTDTVRRIPNGRVQAWFVSDFKLSRHDTSGRYFYRSEMALNEFDCNGRQMGLLSLIRYTEAMGQGQIKQNHSWGPQEVDYIHIPPESISEKMLKAACSIARRS